MGIISTHTLWILNSAALILSDLQYDLVAKFVNKLAAQSFSLGERELFLRNNHSPTNKRKSISFCFRELYSPTNKRKSTSFCFRELFIFAIFRRRVRREPRRKTRRKLRRELR